MKDYDKEFNPVQEQFLQHEIAENGSSVTEIKETLYLTAPYIGYPKTLNALSCVNDVCK